MIDRLLTRLAFSRWSVIPAWIVAIGLPLYVILVVGIWAGAIDGSLGRALGAAVFAGVN